MRGQPCLVLEAAPGAGKTTRVPPALLPLGGEVLVLEPRRLATRMAARRVAQELGERLGETVGYSVRGEHVAGPHTRLHFLTEGILARRLLRDPDLRGVSVVVLDEFHERHLDTDLALALLRRLQQTTRPDLRLLVMSATLEAGPLAEFLGNCPVVRSEGRVFPLTIEHRPASNAPLEERVEAALRDVLRRMPQGDVLCFLPGAAEIRQCLRRCQPLAQQSGALLLPLYGDLSPEEQDRAVLPGPQRKVIFSTNIAESSLTIEGVRIVIDSGLARVAADTAHGMPTLRVARISQASARQRAGRAARTAPGLVIRLYPEDDFANRPMQDEPEIARRELASLVLTVRTLHSEGPTALPWLQPPPSAAIGAAERLLAQLGANTTEGTLTQQGKEMAQLPLHPRWARFLLHAAEHGAAENAAAIAAVLGTGERIDLSRHPPGPSDLLALLDAPLPRAAQQLRQQLLQSVSRQRRPSKQNPDTVLLQALLLAFPDRVARRREVAPEEVQLAAGGTARLGRDSVVRKEPFLVAVEVEYRPQEGLPWVRLASAIEPDWLLEFFPEQVRDESGPRWNRKDERVEEASSLRYGAVTLLETVRPVEHSEAAARLLADKAWEAGRERFFPAEERDELCARAAFAHQHGPVPVLDEAAERAALEAVAWGCRSFRDLEAAARSGFLPALLGQLSPAEQTSLERLAPERLKLPNGRTTRVHYPPGQAPWIASRLQDFYGMRETPRVAGGRVPVLVHLLAPNQRPVQVTADLAGFWQRLYPQVRRELSRRYPKHAWPEQPA